MKDKYTFKQISKEQKKSLDYKIKRAIKVIKKGFEISQTRSSLAFSGGKDSTVLWHLICTHFPEESKNMAVVFGNTGVEFPESLRFARKLGKEWGGTNFYEAKPDLLKRDELKYAAQVQVLEYLIETNQLNKILKADGKLKNTHTLKKACPPNMLERFKEEGLIWKKGTTKSYWWCVDQYGFPILGKSFSKLKARRINIDCFLKFSETSSNKEELKQYYKLLNKVKISQACCDILKKEPSERLQKELKVDVVFKGLMASESRTRKINFSSRGYIFKSSRSYLKSSFYHCNPLSIWTDNDIWEYIHRYNVPYSPLYDIEYKDENGLVCKIKRNGCIGCFTDFGRKNSHMYVLRQTHPNLWKYVMTHGMATEIQKLRTSGSDNIKSKIKDRNRLAIHETLSEIGNSEYDDLIKWAISNRPCAFD